MADFEDLLDDIGTFGPFQVRVFILVSLFETPAAWSVFLPVFIQRMPDWNCTTDEGINSSQAHYVYSSSNKTQFCGQNSRYCDDDDDVIFYTSQTTINMDFALCGKDDIRDLITPLQMFGVLLGACLFGQLADSFGRRHVLYIAYSCLLVVLFATAFTPTWQLYMLCRFLTGFFFGGTMVVNFVLPMEFVGAKWRTFCGCIGFWAIGHMILAPLAYFLTDWRELTMTCALLGLPILVSYPWVPESPRWLIQRHRIHEAHAIMCQIARQNKKKAPELEDVQRVANATSMWLQERGKYSYWDLFRSCKMSKNTLIVVYSWFVSSAVYYGTSFNVTFLTGSIHLNFFLLGLAEIPAIIFVVVVNNRFGRKKTVSLLMLVAGMCCFVIVLLYMLVKDEDAITLFFAVVGKFGISGAWAAAQVFSAELFPTVVRNIGIGASSMAARLGGIMAPVIVDLSSRPEHASLSPLPYAIFGCLAFASGVLSFFLPETLNRPLPDTLPPQQCCCCCRQRFDDVHGEAVCDGDDVKLNGFTSPDIIMSCSQVSDKVELQTLNSGCDSSGNGGGGSSRL